MQALKSFVLMFSVAFLFVGSIGIDVFSHICEEDGVSVSYFVENEEHCDDHDDKYKDACCDEEEDHGCCESELEHIQVKLDFLNSLNVQAVVLATPFEFLPFVCNEIQEEDKHSYNPNKAPPSSSGREVLLKKQYWLI